jgi:hypothetical protein
MGLLSFSLLGAFTFEIGRIMNLDQEIAYAKEDYYA